MSKCKIYISNTTNPWFNLATEDYLFHDMQDFSHILFLWQNDQAVVIGRSQNPWAECHLEKMKQDGIKLARRQSGGGAVFHDLGNTNFTFLSHKAHYDKNANLKIVLQALADCKINAMPSGRNDIVIEDNQGHARKISGSAFREKQDRAFHHGTLLINTDLEKLQHYLNPNKKKLESKGIKSIRSRVANLVEYNAAISHGEVSAAIIAVFNQFYNVEIEPEILDESALKLKSELNERYEKLAHWDWLYGQTLEFTHQFEERFAWGTVNVQLKVNNAVIEDARVYSDSLYPDMIERAQASLIGCAYVPSFIFKKLTALQTEFPMQQDCLQSLSEWIQDQLA